MRQSLAMHQTPTADLIGSAEACQILGIDRSSLVRLAQLGRLATAMKLPGANGARLYRREDVEALAVQRRASA
jgi:predicted site-specific integrase-resolvase